MVKDNLRAFATEDSHPGRVLERVNRVPTKRGLSGFVTAIFRTAATGLEDVWVKNRRRWTISLLRLVRAGGLAVAVQRKDGESFC
jgi:hypothetical protein